MQTRADKDIEVKLMGDSFTETQVALCADYRGLTVLEITKLRQELKKAGAVGRVTKNTLARIAAENAYKDADPAELQKLLATFVGPSLFVFSKADPVSPARVLAEFAKKVDRLKIRGGFFEGNFLNESGVQDLATMPSKEESQARLLATMLAPATQLVRTLMEPAAQLARLLEAWRKEREEKEGGGVQAASEVTPAEVAPAATENAPAATEVAPAASEVPPVDGGSGPADS